MLPIVFRKPNTMPGNFFDEFFNDAFSQTMPTISRNFERKNIPAVNVEETNKEFVIDLAAPGIDKKDFKVSVDDDVLNISSSKEINKEEKKDRFLHREFNYNSFSRSFTLPENSNPSQIKASYKNGVLTINIPKEEVINKAQEIKIN